MKKLIALLLISLSFSASAQIVSGIYMGRLVNDSSKKVQTYELALSEYRGKITGWSYTTFVSNDTFYYSIKRIKATRTADQLILEDDKMYVNNFPEAPAKKVHQINYIQLTNEDTLRTMVGKWETTKTKIYYSLKGGMDIRRGDSSNSALVAHLKELNVIGNDNYRNTAREDVKVKEDRKKGRQDKNQNDVAKVESKKTTAGNKNNGQAASTESAGSKVKNPDAGSKEVIAANNSGTTRTPGSQAGNIQEKGKTTADTQASQTASLITAPAAPEAGSGENMPIRTKTVSGNNTQNNAGPAKPTVARAESFVLPYDKRKMNHTKTVEVTSDSITLAFYDNGVIDGDTISVYLNGEPVINNVKITATAIKKTISVKQLDEIQVLLVAENLGSIPPNTGLLIIKDGEENYQLSFSADMQTNASIVIKKKPK